MVSKASEDLPEPLRPVITVSRFFGMSTSTPFRLCSRAPLTLMWVSILYTDASVCESAWPFQICSLGIGEREEGQRGCPGDGCGGAFGQGQLSPPYGRRPWGGGPRETRWRGRPPSPAPPP